MNRFIRPSFSRNIRRAMASPVANHIWSMRLLGLPHAPQKGTGIENREVQGHWRGLSRQRGKGAQKQHRLYRATPLILQAHSNLFYKVGKLFILEGRQFAEPATASPYGCGTGL